MNLPALSFLSVVIPCFNEEAVLPLLQARLVKALDTLGLPWEVLFIDDGSSDGTYAALVAIHAADPRFKTAALSRNFGHQTAISAGLHLAAGDVVAVMDADLQDPPEILPACLNLLRSGYDVVYAVRRKRKEHLLKRAAYRIFYRFLSIVAEVRIPLDAGDFCLLTRRVVDALKAMPERNIFVRGMRAWAGFRQIALEYEREARAAGETKYPLTKLIRLASDGVFSFSTAPLRLATYLGFCVLSLAVLITLWLLVWRVLGFRFMGHIPSELPGWTALAVGLLSFSGVQLLILGFIGEYIGRIYTEVKRRPRWIFREAAGLHLSEPNRDFARSERDLPDA